MKLPAIAPFAPCARALLRRAALSGVLAAASSAATAAWRARADGASAWAPINDVTHSLWPGEAERARGPSARHTLLGLAIHTGASIFWAVGFEALRDGVDDCTVNRAPCRDAAAAAAIAATAWCVDYHVVPRRLTPGFEAHLSRRSLAWVYGALALGLLAGARCTTAARYG